MRCHLADIGNMILREGLFDTCQTVLTNVLKYQNKFKVSWILIGGLACRQSQMFCFGCWILDHVSKCLKIYRKTFSKKIMLPWYDRRPLIRNRVAGRRGERDGHQMGPGGAGFGSRFVYVTVLCNLVRPCSVWCRVAQYSTEWCSVVSCRVVLCGALSF